MAFQIIWSESASEDLKEIVQYIALSDHSAANNLASRILNRIETASEFPFSNRIVPEKESDSIREIRIGLYIRLNLRKKLFM